LDELDDPRRRRLGLRALNPYEQRLLLAGREPDVGEAVGDQRYADHRDEQGDVLAEQPAARRRSRAGVLRVSGLLSRDAHSITSSARASKMRDTVRPCSRAAFILMTRSNLAGPCTGRSAGLAPLRIRST